ncbi:hypothetical protein BV25DRAFT_410532 [Artomyces pyxidatus]|uniref:Uncharacterized protein n=1 Tax=Artomyces pyxidatus TaxID=48021 RepID=A0ACB8T4V4_9AGAM|nr:hypothetical protein BV25DRAFT_410532 [Artomyces pyxidatus]
MVRRELAPTLGFPRVGPRQHGHRYNLYSGDNYTHCYLTEGVTWKLSGRQCLSRYEQVQCGGFSLGSRHKHAQIIRYYSHAHLEPTQARCSSCPAAPCCSPVFAAGSAATRIDAVNATDAPGATTHPILTRWSGGSSALEPERDDEVKYHNARADNLIESGGMCQGCAAVKDRKRHVVVAQGYAQSPLSSKI